MAVNKEFFMDLLNLDKPILTNKLAPIVKPFAKITYIVYLVLLAISVLASLGLLFTGQFSGFLLALLGVVINFILIRMVCEYLVAPKEDAPKEDAPKSQA